MRAMCLLAVICCIAGCARSQEARRPAPVGPAATAAAGNHVTFNEDQVMLINGRKVFPIGMMSPPPSDGLTPSGGSAMQELRDAGANFLRTGALGADWDESFVQREQGYQDAAAEHGLYCMPYLRQLGSIDGTDPENEAFLRRVVTMFRDHKGMAVWYGVDEPEWGKHPVEPLVRAYTIIKQLDPHHPVWIVQAPRGTVDSMRAYAPAYDATGADIYPISYPPAIHSHLPNDHISVVGDHTKIMMDVAEGKVPVWMVLQIAYSGVLPTRGNTLRFPTWEQQRYMTYQAIATGARGLWYFGGHIGVAMNDRDRELGWNWTQWYRVLRPVVEEIGEHSPLYPALVAPDSMLPIRAADVEMVVREVGDELFIIATKREGEARQIRFLELPADVHEEAEVMFESPRRVIIEKIALDPKKPDELTGSFTDWFAPFDVHVYRLKRQGEKNTR